MPARTSQLQIRVSPQQKAMLRQRARAAGLGMSAYVLSRALESPSDRITPLIRARNLGEALGLEPVAVRTSRRPHRAQRVEQRDGADALGVVGHEVVRCGEAVLEQPTTVVRLTTGPQRRRP